MLGDAPAALKRGKGDVKVPSVYVLYIPQKRRILGVTVRMLI
jgi:hypothetical protein